MVTTIAMDSSRLWCYVLVIEDEDEGALVKLRLKCVTLLVFFSNQEVQVKYGLNAGMRQTGSKRTEYELKDEGKDKGQRRTAKGERMDNRDYNGRLIASLAGDWSQF